MNYGFILFFEPGGRPRLRPVVVFGVLILFSTTISAAGIASVSSFLFSNSGWTEFFFSVRLGMLKRLSSAKAGYLKKGGATSLGSS